MNRLVLPEWRREDLDGIALELEARLLRHGEVLEMGSYARGEPIVHDLDLLLVTNDVDVDLEPILRGLPIQKMKREDKKVILVLNWNERRLRVEIWLCTPDRKGAATLYLRGPLKFNRHMRKIAFQKGMNLDFYGLSDEDGLLESKSEEKIFKKMGLEYLSPDRRVI